MYRPIRLLLPLLCLLSSHLQAAEADRLPQAENLQQLAETAAQRRIPIMLMVSQHHCGFCEQMKNEVLNPMRLSGEYTERVLMRELLIDPGEMLTNFNGQREAAEAFSYRNQVFVTPTLLFFDDRGQETAERILGINTLDYLPFYIDDAIEDAARSMSDR